MVYLDEKKCAQEANDMVGRRLSVLWIFGALTGAVGRASRDNTSHAILAPPHRLALCLTGLINHGEPNGVTGPNLRAALRRPEQLERLGKWLTSIRALNVKVDIFLTLELNDHPKKHPVVSSRARMIIAQGTQSYCWGPVKSAPHSSRSENVVVWLRICHVCVPVCV